MSEKHDDGGPARDMTLLDYFAGQAMAGVLGGKCGERLASKTQDKGLFAAVISEMSYDLAAAMVAEKRRREAAANAAPDKQG